jgi:hypothetical protein
MAVQLESAARLAALRNKADAVTGESSATLSGAVDALIAGFGSGGGGGLELLYETEFSITEKVTGERYLATISTGLTADDMGMGDTIFCVTECINDTDADKSYNHFKCTIEPLYINNASGGVSKGIAAMMYHDNGMSVYTVGCLRVVKVGVYLSTVQIIVRSDFVGYGVPPTGDYTLKLYRLPVDTFHLEVV